FIKSPVLCCGENITFHQVAKFSVPLQNTEKIDFTITNKGDEAEGLSLEVLDGNEVIYSEQQTGKYFDKGEHAWQWDGYSNQGILDTTKLKSKSLLVRLIALCGDMMIKVDYPLHNSPEE
ncbi:hypothetical protein VJW53_23625, partial [Escherichia coli]